MVNGIRRKNYLDGFTLIELMIVVAVIGILAAVFVPKFVELIRKSTEAKTKGNLSQIRSVLSIYYAENEGEYPQDSVAGHQDDQQAKFTGALVPKYMANLPVCYTPPYHSKSDPVTVDYISNLVSADVACDGEWVYVCGRHSNSWGKFFIECYHTDTKGTVWSEH